MMYGLTMGRDTQSRWVVKCARCSVNTTLSSVTEINNLSAALEPPSPTFAVIDSGDLVWQKISYRTRSGDVHEIHECKREWL